jgi:hypothetical protein
LPRTVVRGVSAVIRSRLESAGEALHATCIAADRLMTMASREAKRICVRMAGDHSSGRKGVQRMGSLPRVRNKLLLYTRVSRVTPQQKNFPTTGPP